MLNMGVGYTVNYNKVFDHKNFYRFVRIQAL